MDDLGTQYCDLIGSAALDFHSEGRDNLVDYAKDKGIDLSLYNPIGLNFQIIEHGFKLTFFCEELNVNNREGIKTIVSIDKKEDLDSFLNRVKRFNVVLLYKHIDIESCNVSKKFDETGHQQEYY